VYEPEEKVIASLSSRRWDVVISCRPLVSVTVP